MVRERILELGRVLCLVMGELGRLNLMRWVRVVLLGGDGK